MKVLMYFGLLAVSVISAAAQLSIPQMQSPRGRVAQQVGFTWVTIDYGRPSVKGREIWGNVVPYQQVWRAGANENTVFEVSTDVKINGLTLPAGRYGLHMIPADDGKKQPWGEWDVIFNGDSQAWGSYFYDAKQDKLRVRVTPSSTQFNTELLTYDVPSASSSKATILMRWEKLSLQFEVSVDLGATATAEFRSQLSGLLGFTASNYAQAATWFMNNKLTSPLLEEWVAKALQGSPDFPTRMAAASLAEQKGESDKAQHHREKAIEVATNAQLNNYGYQLLQSGKAEEAIPIFLLNTQRHPDDPNVWDSLGEAYGTAGKKTDAVICFKKALSMNPADPVRQNSESWLKKLQ